MCEPLNIEDAFKQVAIEVKQMALDAIASVNKLAGEISAEFAFEHLLAMDALDVSERLRDAELYQYGEHDMDTEDDFELCVIEFLRSKDARLP